MVRDLVVFYEHPQWFAPLFETLTRRGVDYAALSIQDHSYDPADLELPGAVIFNRLAMSSFLRQSEHALFYSLAVLDHWESLGARVVNGPAALAYDLSKARQLSLFARAGLSVPRTRIAHRLEDLPILAAEVGYPVMIKVNVGGSGAGMTRYSDAAELSAALAAKTTPVSVDGVLLVQAFIPARNGQVFRCEVLDGRLLYAIALSGAGSTFDLCPADVCMIDKPTISIQAHHPAPDIRAAAERVARAAHLDVGGLEYMIDDQTGEALFYDLNALSNFVAKPQDVLGFDPHEPLVDYLMGAVANVRKAAA